MTVAEGEEKISSTHLCHVGDQVQGDVWEGFMEIPTHHVDPREAVSCVGVCFIQSHDVSEVGQLDILLLKADLQKTTQNMEICGPISI